MVVPPAVRARYRRALAAASRPRGQARPTTASRIAAPSGRRFAPVLHRALSVPPFLGRLAGLLPFSCSRQHRRRDRSLDDVHGVVYPDGIQGRARLPGRLRIHRPRGRSTALALRSADTRLPEKPGEQSHDDHSPRPAEDPSGSDSAASEMVRPGMRQYPALTGHGCSAAKPAGAAPRNSVWRIGKWSRTR